MFNVIITGYTALNILQRRRNVPPDAVVVKISEHGGFRSENPRAETAVPDRSRDPDSGSTDTSPILEREHDLTTTGGCMHCHMR